MLIRSGEAPAVGWSRNMLYSGFKTLPRSVVRRQTGFAARITRTLFASSDQDSSMQPETGKLNSKDWASFSICVAFSLTAALVMAAATYTINHIPQIFNDPSNQGIAGIGLGAVWWSSCYAICLPISFCVIIFKTWLRWPILIGATLIAGAYPSFLTGLPREYLGWQISAFSTVGISFIFLLIAQRLFGEISAGLPKPNLSIQVPLSDFFSLTFLCSAVTLALVCMRPSGFSMPILGTLYFLLALSAFVSLPVPVLVFTIFPNSKRKYALLTLVFILPAIAVSLYNWTGLPDMLAFFLTQLALGALLLALRIRGVRILAGE